MNSKKEATSLVHRDFLGENHHNDLANLPRSSRNPGLRCSRKPSTERGTFGFHVWVPEDNFPETLPSWISWISEQKDKSLAGFHAHLAPVNNNIFWSNHYLRIWTLYKRTYCYVQSLQTLLVMKLSLCSSWKKHTLYRCSGGLHPTWLVISTPPKNRKVLGDHHLISTVENRWHIQKHQTHPPMVWFKSRCQFHFSKTVEENPLKTKKDGAPQWCLLVYKPHGNIWQLVRYICHKHP